MPTAKRHRSGPRASARATSRRPTYGAAGRLLRAMFALLRSPRGRELDGLAGELGVSRKTAERYARVLVSEVQGQDGLPLVELVKPGGRPTLRLRGGDTGIDSNVYQAAAMFLAATALRPAAGTVISQGAEDLWEKFKAKLPAKTRAALEHIEKKFFYVPFAAKDYAALDERLDLLLRAVLAQQVLDIRYRRPDGRTHQHRFAPYTLVLYRDGLYLLGQSSRHAKPIYLAIDRIADIQRTGERFAYPSGYNPVRHTDGVFGIWEGGEVTVALRLTGRAAEQIPERRVHRSQTFAPLRGGATLMRVTVRGWQELAWWILSWGGDVEVLEPPELRAYVKRSVQGAAALYSR